MLPVLQKHLFRKSEADRARFSSQKHFSVTIRHISLQNIVSDQMRICTVHVLKNPILNIDIWGKMPLIKLVSRKHLERKERIKEKIESSL